MRSALICTVFLAWLTQAAPAAEPALETKEWNVNGVTRKALLWLPPTATEKESPVIFAFHGHSGTMKQAAETFRYHKLWSEAIVVYMQGLPTPGSITDPDGEKSGWQRRVGDQEDRDLKFFDEVLASLKKDYKVDAKRVYATGHSNGGQFTYELWAARGDVFAAVAPSAGMSPRDFKDLKPLPALHVAGEKDELVKFEWQQRSMDAVRKLNDCEREGKKWTEAGSVVGTIYPSRGGTPFVSLVHPGTHRFPEEAPGLIVKFFKENARK